MKPDYVADVGNMRIKWGACSAHSVARSVALPPDDPTAFEQQLQTWQIPSDSQWVVSGVHPARLDALHAWLTARRQRVTVIDSCQVLPLTVALPAPERVGLDRLFNAVAAQMRLGPGLGAVIIGAGSAVTVDWVDLSGSFRGGAILPGVRLMSRALHDYTALLPEVEIKSSEIPMPGQDTREAIRAGILGAILGGIERLAGPLLNASGRDTRVFLTGGDAALLAPSLKMDVEVWPEMTLEGIRITASGLP